MPKRVITTPVYSNSVEKQQAYICHAFSPELLNAGVSELEEYLKELASVYPKLGSDEKGYKVQIESPLLFQNYLSAHSHVCHLRKKDEQQQRSTEIRKTGRPIS